MFALTVSSAMLSCSSELEVYPSCSHLVTVASLEAMESKVVPHLLLLFLAPALCRSFDIFLFLGSFSSSLTSVGATTSIPETAAFFSSGGFSDIFARPPYQDAAVSQYLAELGSTNEGLYNRTGAGFPDVSAQGENFAVVIDQELVLVDGTSCSSPTFASVIALLNNQLIAEHRSPLGWLNPLLYSVPWALNDVTSGTFTFDIYVSVLWDLTNCYVFRRQPRMWYQRISRAERLGSCMSIHSSSLPHLTCASGLLGYWPWYAKFRCAQDCCGSLELGFAWEKLATVLNLWTMCWSLEWTIMFSTAWLRPSTNKIKWMDFQLPKICIWADSWAAVSLFLSGENEVMYLYIHITSRRSCSFTVIFSDIAVVCLINHTIFESWPVNDCIC